MRTMLVLAALIAPVTAVAAHDNPGDRQRLIDRIAVEEDSHWRDYQTDMSEARRELASDLRRAKTRSDRNEAWAEYRRELADARRDYNQEMRERGHIRGAVDVEEID